MSSEPRRNRGRVIPVVASLVVGLAAPACGASTRQAVSSSTTGRRPAAHAGAGTGAGAASSTLGSSATVVGGSKVGVRVYLPSRTMRPGSSVSATVVVDNATGGVLRVMGCGALLQVALTSASYQPLVAWPRCRSSITLPAGLSTYRVIVNASYLACANPPETGGLPPCLPNHQPPPLPEGRYQARLFQSPIVAPPPAPIPIVVSR